jgi:hypothetical protein
MITIELVCTKHSYNGQARLLEKKRAATGAFFETKYKGTGFAAFFPIWDKFECGDTRAIVCDKRDWKVEIHDV